MKNQKSKKERIAIMLDMRDNNLISLIAESECRSRSNVIQLAVKEFLKNHGYYDTYTLDAPTQPTESPTTGDKATLETDAQQTEPTTGGRTAPLPDSWKKK